MSGSKTVSLLSWYDANRRILPWRAGPGETGDPYHIWLSEIMLQQTTVKAVIPYFLIFIEKWQTVTALGNAPRDDVLKAWAGLGYYARARNLHACARLIAEKYDGAFPRTEAELLKLPGIGAYTAAAIAAIAFGERAAVVDGNIERVMSRAFAIATPLPKAKAEIRTVVGSLTPADRPGDFVQGLMDLGATICTPKSPSCLLCPFEKGCAAHEAGEELLYPVKPAKKERAVRHGHAYFIRDRKGRVLLRQRPDKGLLGGMTEVPTGGWRDIKEAGDVEPPVRGTFSRVPGVVRHVFTHFELRLTVHVGEVGQDAEPDVGFWVDEADLPDQALPSVMRKVVLHAMSAGG